MIKNKKTTSAALSIVVHSVLALAVVRAGYKYAFPEATVSSESVTFEVAQEGDPGAKKAQKNATSEAEKKAVSSKADASADSSDGPSVKPEKESKPLKNAKLAKLPKKSDQKSQPKFVPVKEFNDVVPEDRKDTPEEAAAEPIPVLKEKPKAETEEQPEELVDAKSVVQPQTRAETEPEARPEARTEVQPDAKSETKLESQLQAQTAQNSEDVGGVTAKDTNKKQPGVPNGVGSAARPIDAERLQEIPGNVKPIYSRADAFLRREGVVTLLAFIKQDGSVDLPIVKQSSGYPTLDRSAVTAYQKWRYKPGTSGYALKSFHFKLTR